VNELQRRQALKVLAGAGLAAVVGCSSDDDDAAGGGSSRSSGSSTTTPPGRPSPGGADCDAIPDETAGPYPADGSNEFDVLGDRGIIRSDIRPSYGPYRGTAEGVPVTVELALQDIGLGCSPMGGVAVYLWHCDSVGGYSLYTVEDQNYLRGIQMADRAGKVTFTSVFPGCYPGRWPHMHFEVFPSAALATEGKEQLATSQLALPQDVCEAVYRGDRYGPSLDNLGGTSLQQDMVFQDGSDRQMPTVTGNPSKGYKIALTVPV
jgi:protocatechuate 3,4-dioxygenase beta subunit